MESCFFFVVLFCFFKVCYAMGQRNVVVVRWGSEVKKVFFLFFFIF